MLARFYNANRSVLGVRKGRNMACKTLKETIHKWDGKWRIEGGRSLEVIIEAAIINLIGAL